jgi:hypothetical protein
MGVGRQINKTFSIVAPLTRSAQAGENDTG